MSMEFIKENVEELIDDLSVPSDESIKCESNIWVTFSIPMSHMSEEERAHVFEAARHLSTVGVGFDSGCGCGDFDWEFNGPTTFKGAYLSFHGFPQGYWRGIGTVTNWYLRKYYYGLKWRIYRLIHGRNQPALVTTDELPPPLG